MKALSGFSCFRGIVALFVVVFTLHTATAQVFIPDTIMRNWLNDEVPGIVDAFGIMDTLHPGIATADTLHLDLFGTMNSPALVINTFGLQFLDSLSRCIVEFYGIDSVQLVIPHLSPFQPLELIDLSIVSGGSRVLKLSLPDLPNSLQTMAILGYGPFSELDLAVTALPDSMNQLYITGFDNLTTQWPLALTYVNQFAYSSSTLSGSPGDMPHMNASSVSLVDISFNNGLDMSSVGSLDYLSIQSIFYPLNGPIIFPQSLKVFETMNFSVVPGVQPLVSWPDSIHMILINGASSAPHTLCVPTLPEGLVQLQLNEDFDCIPNFPSTLTNYFGPTDLNFNPIFCSVLNSSCPGAYPGISGHAYIDQNQSGTFDAGEPPMYQVNIGTQPASYLTSCDANGYWEMGVQPGNYTIAPTTTYPYALSFSPAQHTAVLPNLGDADTLNDFGFILMPNVQDLRVSMYAGVARPGFDNRLHLMYKNYGTVAITADLTLTFDADQSWVGSSVTPTTMTGNTVNWNLPNLQIGESGMITVDLHTDSTVALGTAILHDVVLDPLATDTTPSDNVIMWSDTVVGSYDPNDKLLIPAVMTPADVQAGQTPIEYTIRFQNTGTYQAERVVVLDTLSTDLQWNSFDFIGSSHSCNWYMFDGVLHFIFDPIILPDSTSDEPNSHGFVKFSILPSDQLQNGETVENIAHIVFDFNEPIVTPPAVFTVDVTVAITEQRDQDFLIYPNPAHDQLYLRSIGTWNGPTSIRISDALGRVVQDQRMLTNTAVIPLEGLQQGTYLITLRSSDRVATQWFVKQ